MKNKVYIILLCCFSITKVFATEGMWIPSLIHMFHSDMKTHGLKLKAEDIYATNKSSLKDAIVQFDGGCTAEIVSSQGLLFTNHHCGFDAIQQLSTLEKDYLKNGFWAKNQKEELACKGLYVTFVKEIKEVTQDILGNINAELSSQDKSKLINQRISALESKYNDKKGVQAKIKAFNMGNQYFMLITIDYYDIRLVGTPPSSIGKFGGDTDNWVWPRHTGDFSVFRIYADQENAPAEYNPNNKPFLPAHSLPISLKPRKEGDFTMVYGFPGRTDQHYCSEKIKFYQDLERPARIQMRTTTMDVMKPAMNQSDDIRIKYAAKQASIANAWKKWIGQVDGLLTLQAYEKKKKWETEYLTMSKTREEWKKYGEALNQLNMISKEDVKAEYARSLFTEFFFYGPEILNFAQQFNASLQKYETLKKEGKWEKQLENLQQLNNDFYKNYDPALDKKIFFALAPIYLKYGSESFISAKFISKWEQMANQTYTHSLLLQKDKIEKMLQNWNETDLELLKNDPAIQLSNELYQSYLSKIMPGFTQFTQKENQLLQTYVEGLIAMFPKKKNWADANSTLRISYGKIEGSAPHDGMKYTHFTTIDGVIKKYKVNDPDFDLSEQYIKLYQNKDFGQYTQDGKLWVCFTASNHTTGGNSGSPVIDAKGNLLGINFDRSWESTMSDFMFDSSRCRNIVVDARYVLWVIEKYGQAGYLLNEMKIVK